MLKKSKFDTKIGKENNPIFPKDAYGKNKGFPELYKGFVLAMQANGWIQTETHKFIRDFPRKEKLLRPYQLELWIVDGQWYFEFEDKPGYEEYHKNSGPNSFPFNACGDKFTGILAEITWKGGYDFKTEKEENEYRLRNGVWFNEGIFKKLAEYITVMALTLDDYI